MSAVARGMLDPAASASYLIRTASCAGQAAWCSP